MNGKILLIGALVIGFVGLGLGIMACTKAERATGSDQTCPEPLSMVVSMGGKELTIEAPRLSLGFEAVAVAVKNSGQRAITRAEIEITTRAWFHYGEEHYEESEQINVEDLAPGEVQTVVLSSGALGEWKGSIQVRVTKIE